MQFSNKYILGFSLLVCLACSLVVSAFAVSLKEKQKVNRELDMKINVLRVSGLIGSEVTPTPEEIEEFYTKITPQIIERGTHRVLSDAELEELGIDIKTYDPVKAAKDAKLGEDVSGADAKIAQIKRVPKYLLVNDVSWEGNECFVFPIWGNGLWSTLYGYFALRKDGETIQGITYYEHAETPGLGGEVENQAWKASWVGKKAYADDGEVKIAVCKGLGDGPYQIDGLSGATITSNGVTAMLKVWLGEKGYRSYLKNRSEATP